MPYRILLVRARTARVALAVALLLAAPGPPASARGAEIEGVSFAERVVTAGRALELRSLGLLRYRVLFKAYVAALYLEDGAGSGDLFAEDVARRLEIEYFWSIRARDFAAAADRLLARSLDAATLAGLRDRLDRFHRLFRDVAPGDRYALTYLPERGTELSLNGEPVGVAPGADFARAYFGIWLGEDPIDADLRRQLLSLR